MNRGKVVVVGSFNVDHVWTTAALPRAGETLTGGYTTGPGGKGFNQAMAARRAGADTVFICALGDDAGGQLARTLADDDGIELRVLPSMHATGTAGIFVDGEGRNCIVVGAGANAALSDAFVTDQRDAIGDAGVLLAQLESPADAVLAALHIARSTNATTLLNPAPANSTPSAEALALVDVLTPNETEFAALIARHLDERIDAGTIATFDPARLHALCRLLLPEGSVIITLGANGCFVSHPDGTLHGDDEACYRLAAEPARTIDTTGAGDAFNGALAASLAQDPRLSIADHARFASRYAALSTERHGAAAAMPRLQEVVARFRA